MSSGLPINTFAQAKEYRDRYLATLALTVQNDMLNLNANQVFKQTGQPSRPPDTRTTTEKLADLEGMKVSLRVGLLGITDGTQANETIDQLTPDEVVFASQKLPAITMDLKPRFARGVPSTALVNYIRALRQKELQTNGVSFTAQEATAQQILNAIQAGRTQLGGNGGPIQDGIGNAAPSIPRLVRQVTMDEESPMERNIIGPSEDELLAQQNMMRRQADVRRRAEEFLASGREPFTSLPREVQEEVNRIRAERGQGSSQGMALTIGKFRNDTAFQQGAANSVGLSNRQEWDSFPVAGGFAPYPDDEEIAKEYLRMWGRAQTKGVKLQFSDGWERKKSVEAMKDALFPGWMLINASDEEEFELPNFNRGPTKGEFSFERPSRPAIDNTTDVGRWVPPTSAPSETIVAEPVAPKKSPVKAVQAVRVLTSDDVEQASERELREWWNTTSSYYGRKDPAAYDAIIKVASEYGLIKPRTGKYR